jgi:hypothetical protein
MGKVLLFNTVMCLQQNKGSVFLRFEKVRVKMQS